MMRHIRPLSALALVAGALSACQQIDQELPFELDGGGQTQSIDATGGLISVPPDFSISFPVGSLASATQVTAAERITAFPTDAGELVPIAKYDVGPLGTQLLAPATVQIAVPPELLELGEELSLAVALLTQGGSVVTQVTSYDLNSGFLTAQIDELGPVAAVVASDAIPVLNYDSLPDLGGGSLAPPSPAPMPAGPAMDHVPGSVEFTASCSTFGQQCFSSGIVNLWVDDVVRERLGVSMVLMNTTVTGSVHFYSFNQLNLPTLVEAYLEVQGDLRARLNSVVAGRRFGDEVVLYTGGGASPSPTAVTFSGNTMILAETSQGSPEIVEYEVAGIGTGEQLTLRLETTLDFSNADGSTTPGVMVAHVRLRR